MSRTKSSVITAPIKIIAVAGAAALLAALAACSSGAHSPTPPPTSPAAAGSSAAGGHVVTTTTTTDPCQLVNPQEASQLTGATYGPGTEQTAPVGRTCIYGAATKNVFMVDVFQGSAAVLQQVRDHVSAEITQGGHMTPTPISGLGDEATAYHVTTEVFNGASIFVLKGNSAIYLVDEVTGSQAPTTAALTATARTAIARLP